MTQTLIRCARTLRIEDELRIIKEAYRNRPRPGMGILLSYPRSGNHWVRFIVEWFSGAPTLGDGPLSKDPPIFVRQEQGELEHVDPAAPPILKKTHWPPLVTRRDQKLILIVRDYKECLAANRPVWVDDRPSFRALDSYMKLIRYYKRWSSSSRLLLYFGELLGRPKRSISRLTRFMDIYTAEQFNEFMTRYDELAEICQTQYYARGRKEDRMYGKKARRIASEGRKLKHHKSVLTPETWSLYDDYIRERYPDLVPFVERYFEEQP